MVQLWFGFTPGYRPTDEWADGKADGRTETEENALYKKIDINLLDRFWKLAVASIFNSKVKPE